MKQLHTRKDLLKNQKPYCIYMLSNFINRFGDSLDAIATSWLIYEISGNAGMSALAVGVNILPSVIFTPFFGVWVEKLNKKVIMCTVDILRAIIVCIYAVGYVKGFLNAPLILTMTFFISTIEAFGNPATSGFIPSILDEEYYEVGVGTNKAFSGVMELIGAGSAGFIVAKFGLLGAFLIDIITFISSALIKLTIKYKPQDLSNLESKSFSVLLKEGIQGLRSSKLLMFFCIYAAVLNCLIVPFNAFSAPYIGSYLNNNASYLSLFSISLTIGMVIGSYFYPKLSLKLSLKIQLSFVCLAATITYIVLAIIPPLNLSTISTIIFIICGLGLLGIAIGIANSALNVSFMKRIPQDMLSRASAIFSSVALCAMPIASFLLSFLSQFVSLLLVYAISAMLCLIVFVIISKNTTLNE